MLHRRNALKWLSGALATASSAMIAIPGGRFVAGALRSRRRDEAVLQRVARLNDLVPGRPTQVAVVGNRRDAWTLYPDEVIGRVWLVRESKTSGEGQPPRVAAFTAVCPHLGCTIQLGANGEQFVCPCHRAAFALDGAPTNDAEAGEKSHAPRGMDALQCKVTRDANDEWWVEVAYEKFEPGLTTQIRKA
ncbi:MAG TPA: Rieske 2Fe-2S domain-containing protein [Pirellulales bacterium]|nr:Rieske 2Fe-2S domain-containing protein [Pirellulales bacterium]